MNPTDLRKHKGVVLGTQQVGSDTSSTNHKKARGSPVQNVCGLVLNSRIVLLRRARKCFVRVSAALPPISQKKRNTPQKETPKKNQRSTKTCGTKPDM